MMDKWLVIPLIAALTAVFPHPSQADKFSIVVVPDIQELLVNAPEVFLAQMDWIAGNAAEDEENIIYVAQLGDLKNGGECGIAIVTNPEENWDRKLVSDGSGVVTGAAASGETVPYTEWDILDYGFKKLDDAQIPYGVVSGNHDYNPSAVNCFQGDPNDLDNRLLPEYNEFFGADTARFTDKLWYGGNRGTQAGANLGDNENLNSNEDNFTLFSSHGIDFIAINLGYRQFAYPDNGLCADGPKTVHGAGDPHANPQCELLDDELASGGNSLHATEIHWADALLTQYSDRLAIITSHYIMDANSDRSNNDKPLDQRNLLGDYGSQVYDYLRGHQNLFMMLSAHERGEAWCTGPACTDNPPLYPARVAPVQAMLSNYQDLDYPAAPVDFQDLPPNDTGGNSGFLRLLTFDTVDGVVDIKTFSPAVADLPFALDVTDPVADGRDVDLESTVVASDGSNMTSTTASNINGISFVGYVNLPPTAENPGITDNNGGTVDVGDTLTGSYTYNDLDGDTDSSAFRWLRNGIAIGGATAISYTLVTADAGQDVSFEVTPVANTGPAGVAVTSASITVTSNTPPSDSTPDAFGFSNQFNLPINIAATSNTQVIGGINVPTSIAVSGGQYSIDNGAFVSGPGTISNGQNVRLRVISANIFSTPTSATVNIGGVVASFVVTTQLPPPPFFFNEGGDLADGGNGPLLSLLGQGLNVIQGRVECGFLFCSDTVDVFRMSLPAGLEIANIRFDWDGGVLWGNGFAQVSGPGYANSFPVPPNSNLSINLGGVPVPPLFSGNYRFLVDFDIILGFFTDGIWRWEITTVPNPN